MEGSGVPPFVLNAKKRRDSSPLTFIQLHHPKFISRVTEALSKVNSIEQYNEIVMGLGIQVGDTLQSLWADSRTRKALHDELTTKRLTVPFQGQRVVCQFLAEKCLDVIFRLAGSKAHHADSSMLATLLIGTELRQSLSIAATLQKLDIWAGNNWEAPPGNTVWKRPNSFAESIEFMKSNFGDYLKQVQIGKFPQSSFVPTRAILLSVYLSMILDPYFSDSIISDVFQQLQVETIDSQISAPGFLQFLKSIHPESHLPPDQLRLSPGKFYRNGLYDAVVALCRDQPDSRLQYIEFVKASLISPDEESLYKMMIAEFLAETTDDYPFPNLLSTLIASNTPPTDLGAQSRVLRLFRVVNSHFKEVSLPDERKTDFTRYFAKLILADPSVSPRLALRKRSFCDCADCTSEDDTRPLKVCGRCKVQQYCSVDCQAADWPQHKHTCRNPMSSA